MSEIDIRFADNDPIDKIVFSDEGHSFVIATSLKNCDDHFLILDEDGKCSVIIESKEQTVNLIKALQKAIELGWAV